MNYELAQKLKNAGFPQDPAEMKVYGIRVPTLSELISEMTKSYKGFALVAPNDSVPEAVEATDYGLTKHQGGKLLTWRAFVANGTFADGPSPEIAVAMLWLVLNQK